MTKATQCCGGEEKLKTDLLCEEEYGYRCPLCQRRDRRFAFYDDDGNKYLVVCARCGHRTERDMEEMEAPE